MKKSITPRSSRLNVRRISVSTGKFLERLDATMAVLHDSFFFKNKKALCVTIALTETQQVQAIIPIEEIQKLVAKTTI